MKAIHLPSALPATVPDDRSEARISNHRVLTECKSFQTCVSKLCRRFFLNYMPAFFCLATTDVDMCSLYNMFEEVVWSTIGA